MINRAMVFRYHSGQGGKTNNFAFQVKAILYYHSARPDDLVPEIHRVRWPLWMTGLTPEDSFRVLPLRLMHFYF